MSDLQLLGQCRLVGGFIQALTGGHTERCSILATDQGDGDNEEDDEITFALDHASLFVRGRVLGCR